MNCKPGDLAVVVRRDSPNYGRFVVVLEPYDGRVGPAGRYYEDTGTFCWIVKGHGLVLPGSGIAAPWHVAEDRYLRPIRDNDGTDESLTWAGKPQPVEA